MSFSAEIKNELIKIDDMPSCCRQAMAYGMLLFGRNFNSGDISIMTDNAGVAEKYVELLRSVTGVEANVSVSDDKPADVQELYCSIYILSAIALSVMIVAGFEFTRTTSSPSCLSARQACVPA